MTLFFMLALEQMTNDYSAKFLSKQFCKIWAVHKAHRSILSETMLSYVHSQHAQLSYCSTYYIYVVTNLMFYSGITQH